MGEFYRDAAKLVGTYMTQVQIAVEEQGRPWDSDTAVLLVGNRNGVETRIDVGSPEEIATLVRTWVKRLNETEDLEAQRVIRWPTRPWAKKKPRVRWVTRGDLGTWVTSELEPRGRK